MVYGIEKFKEYFSDYTGQYVFIGGTACDILLEEIGSTFRATKDLDMVLIIEALDESFGKKFWEFIQDGGYEYREKSTGKHQFYRFVKPSKFGFPTMIELFSHKPENMQFNFEQFLTPIHIGDEIASLSAILLNDAYYKLLLNGKRIVDGYSVLDLEYIILFKIRAWLDFIQQIQAGELVDSRTLKKHKNDIFRLLINVSPLTKIEVEDEINKDIVQFLVKIRDYKPELKHIGIEMLTFEELLDRIRELYGIIR